MKPELLMKEIQTLHKALRLCGRIAQAGQEWDIDKQTNDVFGLIINLSNDMVETSIYDIEKMKGE